MMDEPTAGIDIGAKTEIIEIIREFAAKKKGVIFVSSELSELLAVCDRILVFKKGSVAKEIICNETISEEELQHAIQH